MEGAAEAAAEGLEEEDVGRDGHQGQRVRGLLPQEGAPHGLSLLLLLFLT